VIISQASTTDWQIDLGDLDRSDRLKDSGHHSVERDAEHGALGDPDREIALERRH
jgi:hypothetical protein